VLDLSIYKYNLTAGQLDPQMPGLFTGLPPRRAARGREQDRLVLFLSFEGSTALPAETQREFLEKLTTVFYNTPGTVTYALKAVATQLNDRLLARNLRSRDGQVAIGLFTGMVLHGSMLVTAQSGPTHTFILGRSGNQHNFELEDAGRGLGSNRTAEVRFYRSDLQDGDRIIVCANLPSNWTAAVLQAASTTPLEQIRSRLTDLSTQNLHFILLQAEKGKGLLPIRDLSEISMEQAIPVSSQQQSTDVQPPAVARPADAGIYLSGDPSTTEESEPSTPLGESGEKVAGLFAGLLASRKKIEPPAQPAEMELQETAPHPESDVTPEAEVDDFPAAQPSRTSEPWTPDSGEPDFTTQTPPATAQAPAEPVARRQTARRTRAALAGGLRGWRAFKSRLSSGFLTLMARIIPGQADKLPTIAPGVLVFIAVAVPLVIVAVATTVYIQTGRGQQREVYLSQSLAAITQAQAQTDPVLQRVNYEAALDWVKKAEEYGSTDQSRALKAQISGAIDSMDGITRFELHPALPTDFDRGVRITQIWSSTTEDLYLLDSTNGKVFRMVYTRPGYQLDPQFSCGPGMIGSLIIGPLVDMVLAPPGNTFDSVVMAIDGGGNLLYCSLNPAKTTAVTLPPPDAGWTKIQAIAYQSGVLTVLDPGGNGVWRYEGYNLNFSDQPRLFFDNVVPNLAGAIDLAVYLDDLYVLNQDGHMVVCTYSNVEITPTRCTDPSPYRMGAAGQPPQEVTSINAQFTQIQATQPPEPSLYFLDASGRAVYQFSMSLNFVRRLQPTTNADNPLPGTAPTALAITGGRNLVLAYDNRVFIAAMPAP